MDTMIRSAPRTANVHFRISEADKRQLEAWARSLKYDTMTDFLMTAAKLHKENGR
jgi:uncharacterized protein (DUF1778 family)